MEICLLFERWLWSFYHSGHHLNWILRPHCIQILCVFFLSWLISMQVNLTTKSRRKCIICLSMIFFSFITTTTNVYYKLKLHFLTRNSKYKVTQNSTCSQFDNENGFKNQPEILMKICIFMCKNYTACNITIINLCNKFWCITKNIKRLKHISPQATI